MQCQRLRLINQVLVFIKMLRAAAPVWTLLCRLLTTCGGLDVPETESHLRQSGLLAANTNVRAAGRPGNTAFVALCSFDCCYHRPVFTFFANE